MDHEGLEEAGGRGLYIGREALMAKLIARYNMTGRGPKERIVRLPFSKEVVKIPCHDVKDCMLQLLTNPRIQDEDYCFFDDDPLAPPPEDLDYIADTPTSEGYKKTHDALCGDDPKKVLVGVLFYIDGAVTGQFSDLPVTVLKMVSDIFKTVTGKSEN